MISACFNMISRRLLCVYAVLVYGSCLDFQLKAMSVVLVRYWLVFLYQVLAFIRYKNAYPATTIAGAAQFPRIKRRCLQQTATFSGLAKVVFAYFCHSLYSNRTPYRDCNAVDRISKFTFGRII